MLKEINFVNKTADLSEGAISSALGGPVIPPLFPRWCSRWQATAFRFLHALSPHNWKVAPFASMFASGLEHGADAGQQVRLHAVGHGRTPPRLDRLDQLLNRERVL